MTPRGTPPASDRLHRRGPDGDRDHRHGLRGRLGRPGCGGPAILQHKQYRCLALRGPPVGAARLRQVHAGAWLPELPRSRPGRRLRSRRCARTPSSTRTTRSSRRPTASASPAGLIRTRAPRVRREALRAIDGGVTRQYTEKGRSNDIRRATATQCSQRVWPRFHTARERGATSPTPALGSACRSRRNLPETFPPVQRARYAHPRSEGGPHGA
jgi:hypothetical protein